MPSRNTHRRYPINQSPLYRLRGKGQLEKVIGVQWDAADKLLTPDNYRVWVNDKGREIQKPLGFLNHVHAQIGKLLARIEAPDYLYSQKGRSYADNARQHIGNVPLVKTDIHKFYPSTSRQMVYRLFAVDFNCADDLAHRLADICCYRQEHIPTGSPLSDRVAFFAAKHMFDAIDTAAEYAQCQMTVYVDDITVSGKGATMKLLGKMRQIVRQHGLKTKQRKSKSYAATAAKPVTGAIIADSELRLPNVRHKKIWETKQQLINAPHEKKKHIQQMLRGRLQEAKQILAPRK